MFCRRCGNAIPDTVKFCVCCGAPVPATEPPVPQAEPPAPRAEPPQEKPRAPEPPRRSAKRTRTLIFVLALIAAFVVGMLAGFFLCSALTADAPAATAAVWAATDVHVGKNDAGSLYAAFTVTADTAADRLYVVIETEQDGVLLRSPKSKDDGRMFENVTAGTALRVKLFADYDDFAPTGGAFTANDGTVFRNGGQAPLSYYLAAGLPGNVYVFRFFDGNTCIGYCELTIDFA